MQGGLILAAGRVGSKIKKNRQKTPTKSAPPKTHHERYPQQPGDRDHLETTLDEARPTREPILTCFHRSRGCGNRPRAALAISKNDECYTYSQTDGQTDKLNNDTL